MYGPAIAGAEDVPTGAEAMVREVAAAITRRYPDVDVTATVVAGNPAGVLTEQSHAAALVVVGSRGRGRFAELLAGSVSTQVATYARSPVIVVRSPGFVPSPDGKPADVVVGVDGSSGGDAALGFAFEEALARRGDLVAVYVWRELPDDNLDAGSERPNPDEARSEADRLLAEALAGWQSKYPDITVRRRTVRGDHPAPALMEEARQASMIVVGSRGLGGFRGLLLGSVGDTLLRHARQPVTIVHGDGRPV
jgi:nucleotide-binding universal stress UspA family protein